MKWNLYAPLSKKARPSHLLSSRLNEFAQLDNLEFVMIDFRLDSLVLLLLSWVEWLIPRIRKSLQIQFTVGKITVKVCYPTSHSNLELFVGRIKLRDSMKKLVEQQQLLLS